MSEKKFTVSKKSKHSKARLGSLKTNHSVLHTPFFMPIATKGAVKHLGVDDLKLLKPEIILSNTYHLYLTPGEDLVRKFGGLHSFMDWNGAILTDSGGYQVFSLGGHKAQKNELVKIDPKGVQFRSHIDGSKHYFTPKKSIQIQQKLGVDIMMAFDVCPPAHADEAEMLCAVTYTTDWAKQCKKEWKQGTYAKPGQLLFGIVQGGTDIAMRKRSIQELEALDFSGYALGGLAVGEERSKMYETLEAVTPLLPLDKPRYLMGVGKPEEIVMAVRQGVDMFDCVIPTREARHGRLYVQCKKGERDAIHLWGNFYYRTINVFSSKLRFDKTPINAASTHPLLNKYTRGYLHHLFRTQEGLALRISTIQNLEFYLGLMTKIQLAIKNGKF